MEHTHKHRDLCNEVTLHEQCKDSSQFRGVQSKLHQLHHASRSKEYELVGKGQHIEDRAQK